VRKISTGLQKERLLLALTISDVGYLAGIVGGAPILKARIHQLEKGISPRPDEREVLSNLFNVSPEELFERI